MCAVGVHETALLVECGLWRVEKRRLFYVFDECTETGAFGREEQNEAQAKSTA